MFYKIRALDTANIHYWNTRHMCVLKTIVQSNLAKDRIAVLLTLAASNGFVRSWSPYNTGTWFQGTTWASQTQTGSRSVQPFWTAHSCDQCTQTNRHTDHCVYAMRPKTQRKRCSVCPSVTNRCYIEATELIELVFDKRLPLAYSAMCWNGIRVSPPQIG